MSSMCQLHKQKLAEKLELIAGRICRPIVFFQMLSDLCHKMANLLSYKFQIHFCLLKSEIVDTSKISTCHPSMETAVAMKGIQKATTMLLPIPNNLDMLFFFWE